MTTSRDLVYHTEVVFLCFHCSLFFRAQPSMEAGRPTLGAGRHEGRQTDSRSEPGQVKEKAKSKVLDATGAVRASETNVENQFNRSATARLPPPPSRPTTATAAVRPRLRVRVRPSPQQGTLHRTIGVPGWAEWFPAGRVRAAGQQKESLRTTRGRSFQVFRC